METRRSKPRAQRVSNKVRRGQGRCRAGRRMACSFTVGHLR